MDDYLESFFEDHDNPVVPIAPFREQLPYRRNVAKSLKHPSITRRSHKKSRRGCLKCKARKIKCGEEKPVCTNCKLKEYQCEYQPPELPKGDRSRVAASSTLDRSLSSTTPSFTLNDLRFFHHFLTLAKPSLPAGNDVAWSMDIPQFAHEHEFLMHAMLGLGGTHLDCMTPDLGCKTTALTHRICAIDGLKRKMAQNSWTYGEADAVLAACYSLIFQSVYLPDGLADFATLVRGAGILTEKIRGNKTTTAFDLNPVLYFEILKPRMRYLPQIDMRLLSMALESLLKIKPLLVDELENDFYYSLWNVFSNHQASPQAGYIAFAGVYGFWGDLPHDKFQELLDPSRVNLQLLWAHWVALQLMTVPLSAVEGADKPDAAGSLRLLFGMVSWSEKVWENVPRDMHGYLTFSKYVAHTMRKETKLEHVDGPSVLQAGAIIKIVEEIRGLKCI